MDTQRFIHTADCKQIKGFIKSCGFSKLKQFENTASIFHQDNSTFVLDKIDISPFSIIFGKDDSFCRNVLEFANNFVGPYKENISYFCIIYVMLPRCTPCDRWIVYSTHNIFNEIKKLEVNKLQMYMWSGSYWSGIRATYKKTYNTYFVDEDIKIKMMSIVKKFKQSKNVYDQKGIPYKLSILLEGEPGTGKTSFVKVISREEALNIYIVNAVDIATHIDVVVSELNLRKRKLIILVVEDIHKIPTVFYGHLYNLLDGIYDVTNCIIVMTSNLPHEKLDKTLIRPGRVNYIFKLGYLSDSTKRQMLDILIPNDDNKTHTIDIIIKKTKDIQLTPATLENWIQHNLLEQTFYDHVEELVKMCKTQQYEWDTNDPNLYT